MKKSIIIIFLLPFLLLGCVQNSKLMDPNNLLTYKINNNPLKPFPKNFLWGVATAGYQVEGNLTTSQWQEWEIQGKTLHKSGKAADFLNRYPQDINLAKDIGINAFRFSIEWARIEPIKGSYDIQALNYYKNLIATIKQAGMEPIVTLLHFTYPQWLDWEDSKSVDYFINYVEFIVKNFGKDVKYYITFNEPNVWLVTSWIAGATPPGKKSFIAAYKVLKNVLKAHKQAYDVIHRLDKDSMVSSNIFQIVFKPFGRHLTPHSFDYYDTNWFLESYIEEENETRLTQVSLLKKLDYIAFDYYYRFYSFKDIIDAGYKPWLGKIYPEGLYNTLKDYAKHYPTKPILIAENGMCTEDLTQRKDGWTREEHLRKHIYYLQKAVSEGVNVIGYCYWSLMDNYEWGSYIPRFGLFTVNILTDPSLTRIPTPAVQVYRQIIKNNGIQ